MKYRLQQYEDGTFGYLNVDGDLYTKKYNGAKVILSQPEDMDRDDFIIVNNITFKPKQYGSNLFLDLSIIKSNEEIALSEEYGIERIIEIEDKPWLRRAVAEKGCCLDILVNDPDETVRAVVAKQGYGLDILAKDNSLFVVSAVAEMAEKLHRQDVLDKLMKSKFRTKIFDERTLIVKYTSKIEKLYEEIKDLINSKYKSYIQKGPDWYRTPYYQEVKLIKSEIVPYILFEIKIGTTGMYDTSGICYRAVLLPDNVTTLTKLGRSFELVKDVKFSTTNTKKFINEVETNLKSFDFDE